MWICKHNKEEPAWVEYTKTVLDPRHRKVFVKLWEGSDGIYRVSKTLVNGNRVSSMLPIGITLDEAFKKANEYGDR